MSSVSTSRTRATPTSPGSSRLRNRDVGSPAARRRAGRRLADGRDRIAPRRWPRRHEILLAGLAAKAAALGAGALGSSISISGGGSTAFALTDGDEVAAAVTRAMIAAYAGNRIDATGRAACVEQRGARIVEATP